MQQALFSMRQTPDLAEIMRGEMTAHTKQMGQLASLQMMYPATAADNLHTAAGPSKAAAEARHDKPA
jgi:hypothetical protein